MNTIHSSSLAYYRTGPKPDQPRVDQNQRLDTVAKATTNDARNAPQQAASTPERIRSVIAKQGLERIDNDQLASSPYNAKAINAYAETYKQSAYAAINQMISGVDLFV